MSLAYVITVHKNPGQLARLLKAINDPANTYVLHVDAKADRAVHSAVRNFAATHANASVIPSESVIWGSWRLAHAQVRGITEALRINPAWTHCLNLSGQDYPLRTQSEIHAALTGGAADASYMEVLDFATASVNARKRMEFFWFPWRGKMRKFLRRRPPKFKVYWGSNHFALSRAACEHVAISDVSKHMHRYFRHTLCADEMIFQNALMHGPAAIRDSIINKTYRKLTWAGGSHPMTYTIADKDELLSSDAWFARKFDDAVDVAILDALDASIQERTRSFDH